MRTTTLLPLLLSAASWAAPGPAQEPPSARAPQAAPVAEAALSYFLPTEGRCDWRLLSLEDLSERRLARMEGCPTRLSWLGPLAVLSNDAQVWFGDWEKADIRPAPTLPPIPHRGWIERLGFDGAGRSAVIVAEPLVGAEAERTVPGPGQTTHLAAAYAFEDGVWKLLMREKVVIGPASARGTAPLAEKLGWQGASLSERLSEMDPSPRTPRLVLKKGRLFSRERGRLTFVTTLKDTQGKLLPDLLPAKGNAGEYYAVLATDPPLRFVLCRVSIVEGAGTAKPTFVLPLHGTDVERGGPLRIVDDQARLTPQIGLAVRRGFLLTVEAGSGRWPRLFGGFDFSVAFESPDASGAFFFP